MIPLLHTTHSHGEKNNLGIYFVITSVTAFNPAFPQNSWYLRSYITLKCSFEAKLKSHICLYIFFLLLVTFIFQFFFVRTYPIKKDFLKVILKRFYFFIHFSGSCLNVYPTFTKGLPAVCFGTRNCSIGTIISFSKIYSHIIIAQIIIIQETYDWGLFSFC